MDHVVFFPYPMWGHAKPAYGLASRIVHAKPVQITILTAKDYLDRILAQVADPRFALPDGRRNLIRVICLDVEASQGFGVLASTPKVFPDAYKALFECQPLKCAATGVTHEAWPSPSALILDVFGYPCLQAARATSGQKVPILAWNSSNAARMLHDFGPESEGGPGDIVVKAQVLAKAQGREDVHTVAREIYTDRKAELHRIPGLPEMYEYEFMPQILPLLDATFMLPSQINKFLVECDGIVQGTSDVVEPESIQALKAWLAKTSRQVYTFCCVGYPGVRAEEDKPDFKAFLDGVLAKHGANSMIYIAFGTTFWPSEPDKVWAFIDVLLEMKTPFLFSYPAHAAKIPADLPSRVKDSGLGFMASWSPQEAVLNHPATGWFVTHSGQNSVIESLEAGVPMICWPFGGDQPVNAAVMSEGLDVAYELLQVRSGENGLRPLRRSGANAKPISGTVDAVVEEAREVLAKAMGPDGARKRQNAQVIKRRLYEAWEEPSGACVLEVKRFVESLGGRK